MAKDGGSPAVNPKRDAGSASFIASIELEAPRSPGQSSISNIYRLHFTSPLSGSVLYGITRDVKFSHLPKDRIAAGEWAKTLDAYWGEPYAVAGPDQHNVIHAAFFFNDAGVATARGESVCSTMFPKMDAITRNAGRNIKDIIGEIEREDCHFLVEARQSWGNVISSCERCRAARTFALMRET